MADKIWCPIFGRRVNISECEDCDVKGDCKAYGAYLEGQQEAQSEKM